MLNVNKFVVQALLCLLVMLGAHSLQAQVRFLKVDPVSDEISIKNFGTTMVDLSNYDLCALFVYSPGPLSSLTVQSGSLMLAAGDTLTLTGFSLDDNSSDLGLYLPGGSFGSAASMVDFTQWGAGGQGRESVAVTKGIWTAGDFLTGPAPYTYTGNGTDNGLSFWQGAGVANVRILAVDPATDQVWIKNFGTASLDISAYRFCALFTYTGTGLSSLTVQSGSLVLDAGDTVALTGFALNDNASDLGLYLASGSFGSPANMVDFTQWGAGGQGRESVAVTKGIWTAGDFLTGMAPYSYTGNGSDNGLPFWEAAPSAAPDAIYEAFLSGNQERVPVLTSAKGQVTAELTGDTLVVSGAFSGLKGDFAVNVAGGAHIHLGYAGQNGGIQLPLNSDLDPDLKGGVFSADSNRFVLTPGQKAALQNRQFYVNIHSTIYTGGELRGQLLLQADAYYSTQLAGSNAVPPILTEASGALMIEVRGTEITVSGSFANLAGDFASNIAGGAHLHGALAGSTAGIQVGLDATLDGNLRGGVFEADSNVITLTQTQLDLLEARSLYANLHSLAYTSGELRGQVNTLSHAIFRAHLAGSNARTPIVTGATGQVAFELVDSTLIVSGSFNGLSSKVATNIAGGAHLHLGYAGQNGGIQIILAPTLNADSLGGRFEAASNTFQLNAAQYTALFNRRLYVNIHSLTYGSGEIRGQVLPESQYVFGDFITGTQSSSNVLTGASGSIKTEIRGNQLVVTGSFAGLESDLNTAINGGVHLHLAPAGSNGPIAIVLKTTLDANNRSGFWEADSNTFVISNGLKDTLKARQMYVNIHSMDVPSGELRGQLLHEALAYFSAPLSGTSQLTPVKTGSRGAVMAEWNGGRMFVSGSFRNLESDFNAAVAGGAHIHVGLPGKNGGIKYPLNTQLAGTNRSGIFLPDSNTFVITPGAADTLRARMLYVNIHSTNVPSGEIRGNILPQANAYFTTSLKGKNAVVPNESNGTGALKLELSGSNLTITGGFSGLTGDYDPNVAGGSHLHLGGPGTGGGIVIGLVPTLDGDLKGGVYVADSNRFALDSAALANLRSGDLYFNLHTTTVGSGEIRGQILPESNFYTGATTITSPPDMATIDVAGDDTTSLVIEWDVATDPDANEVVYLYQLSDTTDMSNLLMYSRQGSATELSFSLADMDTLLQSLGANVGDTVTLYHRVISTDGSVCTEGPITSADFIRGVVINTAVDEQIADRFAVKVYPSPTADLAWVEIDADFNGAGNLRVLDLTGRVLHREEVRIQSGENRYQLDFSTFLSGLYLIQVETEAGILRPFKLVKN